jgi:hypothetical protein
VRRARPLRFHPDVGVVLQHLLRDVPGDPHDGLIARFRLGKFRDGLVPQIVEAESAERALDCGGIRLAPGADHGGILEESARGTLNRPRQSAPCCPPALQRTCRVDLLDPRSL